MFPQIFEDRETGVARFLSANGCDSGFHTMQELYFKTVSCLPVSGKYQPFPCFFGFLSFFVVLCRKTVHNFYFLLLLKNF